MSAKEIVIDSASAAAATVGTDEFAKLTKYALNLNGARITQHLKAGDHPGLFSPADIEKDGKLRLGAILALEDRVIIAWTVGAFRMKSFDKVIPRGSIEHVEVTTRREAKCQRTARFCGSVLVGRRGTLFSQTSLTVGGASFRSSREFSMDRSVPSLSRADRTHACRSPTSESLVDMTPQQVARAADRHDRRLGVRGRRRKDRARSASAVGRRAFVGDRRRCRYRLDLGND